MVSRGVLSDLDLSPYVLEDVFKMMDLQDQYNLALAAAHFYRVFTDVICPRLRGTLNLKDFVHYNRAELEKLFQALAEHSTELQVPAEAYDWQMQEHSTLQSLIKEKLVKLVALRIQRQRPQVATNYFRALQVDCVTELELYNCNLRDTSIQYISEMRNLEALGLAKNGFITGKYIGQLPKLHKLSLFQCSRVTATNLNCIFSKGILSYLDMRQIRITTLSWHVLRRLTRIEHLRADVRVCIFNRLRPRMFGELTHLTALELDGRMYANVTAHFIARVLRNVGSEMRELRLTTAFELITAELISAIGDLHGLRVLHLKNYHVDMQHPWFFQVSIASLSNLQELAFHDSANVLKIILPVLAQLPNLRTLSLGGEGNFLLNDVQELVNILQEQADQQTTVTPLVLNVCRPILLRRLLDPICSGNCHLLTIKVHSELSGSLDETKYIV